MSCSVESQRKKEIVCYPWSNDKVHVKATQFWKPSKDPEPLWGTFARQHTQQNISREHQLCEEIRDFSYDAQKSG